MMRMVTIMKGKSLDCERLSVVSPDRKLLKYLAGEEPQELTSAHKKVQEVVYIHVC